MRVGGITETETKKLAAVAQLMRVSVAWDMNLLYKSSLMFHRGRSSLTRQYVHTLGGITSP